MPRCWVSAGLKPSYACPGVSDKGSNRVDQELELERLRILFWIAEFGSEGLRALTASVSADDRGLLDAYARERTNKDLPGFTLVGGLGYAGLQDRWETLARSKAEVHAVSELYAKLRELGFEAARVGVILSPYRPNTRSRPGRDDRDCSVWLEVRHYPSNRQRVHRRLSYRRGALAD